MAKIEITVPGERIVEDFTALVPQPTLPSTARAPDVGLVELSYVNPTDLIAGPPGPPGPAGTRWYTGVGDPTITGAKLGDYYLDDVTGYIWTWNGTAWVMTGTDLSPDASELLLKIKTVDGSGSGLDADTLDGQDGSYYLDWDNFTDKPTTFPPTLPIAQSDVTNLVSDLALKAPIASPTFTGDPKAPTPAAADNDTSIATTAFVKSVVGTVNPFPEAPVDGLTYGRKNAAWATIVGGAVVSDLAPGGPLQNGQLWFKSNSGDTYIWVDDGNSQQWVQQNILPPMTIPSNYITATAEPRNRIVNGAMQISQQNVNTAGTTDGYYAADQWQVWRTTGGTMTFQRVQVATPNGSRNRLRLTVTVADAALAAGDYLQFYQTIEGVRVADFGWGAAGARQVVLRFGWKSPAGTYSINFANPVSDRSYVANFTVSAGQANTDTVQTFVVPGDVTGTWPTDTGLGVQLGITIAAGSASIGTTGWSAAPALGTASNTNGMATAGNVFELFDVGLYLDPNNTGVPPPWQMPDEAAELQACQRYFQWLGFNYGFFQQLGQENHWVQQPLLCRMRVTPTAGGLVSDPEGTGPSTSNNAANLLTAINPYTGRINITGTATASVNVIVFGYRSSMSARM